MKFYFRLVSYQTGTGERGKWITNDTRQLLQALQQAPSQQALPDRTLEAVQIRCFRDAHLVSVVSFDLG
jgi:hypothetical protein